MLGPHDPQTFYLNKLETSCPTDVSDKSWLPCYCWFFRRRFLKLFPIKAYVKLWTPNDRTPWTPDLHLNKLETSCSTDVSDISWLLCYCFFRRRFLKLFPIKGNVKLQTPNARIPWIPLTFIWIHTWYIMSYWCFRQIMTVLLLLVLRKIFLRLLGCAHLLVLIYLFLGNTEVFPFVDEF